MTWPSGHAKNKKNLARYPLFTIRAPIDAQIGNGSREFLTVRRSRAPTAPAELRALARSKIHLCRPAFIPAFCPSQRFGLWGLAVAPGFACNHCAGFKPFWPLAPVPRALAALSLVAFRGCAALFQTPSGLTRRSSRSAFGGRLTSFVRPHKHAHRVTPHAQVPSKAAGVARLGLRCSTC